jgi:TonB family protein
VSTVPLRFWNRLIMVIPLLLSGRVLAAQDTRPLPATPSAGTAIQEAARAAAEKLGRPGIIEVLSDTQGVDFGPYLKDVVKTVRENWVGRIPASEQRKKGRLAIEFAITKNGKIAGMKLVAASGDMELDRAAWSGITTSDPLPPLPVEFKGQYLALRFRFFYNPDKAELAEANTSAPEPAIVHAVLMTHESELHLPKYPKKAHQAKTEGLVRLDVDVGIDGKVRDIKILEGDPVLADASVRAIRKWRFYPAQKDGKAVGDLVRIRVDFRLDQEQVRAQVVSYPDPAAGPAQ